MLWHFRNVGTELLPRVAGLCWRPTSELHASGIYFAITRYALPGLSSKHTGADIEVNIYCSMTSLASSMYFACLMLGYAVYSHLASTCASITGRGESETVRCPVINGSVRSISFVYEPYFRGSELLED